MQQMIVVTPLTIAGVTYGRGDKIPDSLFQLVSLSLQYKSNTVLVNGYNVGGSPPGNGDNVTPQVPFNIPAGTTTNGQLSPTPVVVRAVVNMDTIPQGCKLTLFDCVNLSDIGTAPVVFNGDLGGTQRIPLAYPTQNGLCYALTAGDSGATVINPTGYGVNIEWSYT
jgi:hypothetical protein